MEIKKNNQAEELFEKIQVDNTPFLIIYNKEQKIAFGVFGQYKITKDFDNTDDVRKELTNMTWDKIITVMSLVYEMLKSQNQPKSDQI